MKCATNCIPYIFSLLCTVAHAQSFEEIFNQANSLHYQKQFVQAIALYDQALLIQPDSPQTHFNKGVSFAYCNNHHAAIEAYLQAISHNKNYTKAYTHLIDALMTCKKYDQTTSWVKKLIELNPHDRKLLGTIAQKAIDHDDLAAASAAYAHLVSLSPDDAALLYNYAYILSRTNDNQKAVEYYKKAIEKGSTTGSPKLGLAKALLSTGDWGQGWHYFEWRLGDRKNYQRAFGYLNLKPQDVKGKRVLIRAEWGLGDMIHFMRYAKILKQAGATVILQAFDPLLQLFKRCDFLDGVIGQHDSIPPVDIHIPLLSLPLICGTILETIPADIPYIFADPVLIDYWHEQLKSDENLKVGICWHAKPIYIEDHMFTRRSIALEEFIPLALEHVSFYSLQKEFGTDEIQKIASSPLAVATFGDDFDVSHGRFSDTAAVIMNMDLVITADTSIVHVAGALGKQVWVLLPYAAEWRWLPSHPKYAHSSSTPWYPNMRLFRQTTPGDWTAVIHEVRQALIKLVKK